MQEYHQIYAKWRDKANCPHLQEELVLVENKHEEILDRFYKNLEFGTGGLRGIIGAGPNRMNIYTVRKATQGLANYINNTVRDEDKKVIIAYDSRHKSRDFALEAALVLVQNRIKTYVFPEITPTPLLSYAVRDRRALFGIVITASHNPKEYNGYKVYHSHGGQITDTLAAELTAEINGISDEFAIETAVLREAEQSGLLVWLDDAILAKYLEETSALVLNKEMIKKNPSQLKIVYSPLHGTGLKPVKLLLEKCGFAGLYIVEQQALADPDFPTVVCPNPEEKAACSMALDVATQKEADIILLTDPDADRIGVAARNSSGDYVQLTGNQIGALLIDYILQTRKNMGLLAANGVIVKTIVTSRMGAEIAAKYGVKTIDVLTGFKYIGEKITEFELKKEHTFLFGYEESHGYLLKSHVRDKDAIQAALGVAEMALFHKLNGINLLTRLDRLFQEFGFFREDLVNITLTGMEGQKRIAEIMDRLRKAPPAPLLKHSLVSTKDYLERRAYDPAGQSSSELNLPSSNVVLFELPNDAWCCVRPSGTEPKLKIYFGVREKSAVSADEKLQILKNDLLSFLGLT